MHEFGVVGPKFSTVRGKYGKLHASKEILWTERQAFFLPKGSPLHVSTLFL